METQELAALWMKLKNEEESIKRERMALEEQLISKLGIREEGGQTHKVGEFKVKIESKINRTLDKDKWAEIRDMIPSDVSPIIYKPEINNKKLKDLIIHDASMFRMVCRAITSKPGKPYVVISYDESK